MIHNSELKDVFFSRNMPKHKSSGTFTDIYVLPQQNGMKRVEQKIVAKNFLQEILLRYSQPSNSLHTSKSYAADCIAISISDGDVGIDIAQLNMDLDFQDIAEACFSVKEIRALDSANAVMFFRNWTRKEAILKAAGVGIIEDMQHIPAMDGSHDALLPAVFQEKYDYHVYTVRIADHLLSVCSHYTSQFLNFYKLSASEP